jgi:hypothetical protein
MVQSGAGAFYPPSLKKKKSAAIISAMRIIDAFHGEPLLY